MKTPILIEHKWQFLFLFSGVFFITLSIFSAVGFVPYGANGSMALDSAGNTAEASVVESESNPVHITIPSIGINVNVENPQSNNIKILDEALNRGAVRYPGTGTLTQNANIFIFGHSSFLPNIVNKNYQAFNNLNKVNIGEEIFVDSKDTRYVYRVTSVKLGQAEKIKVDLRHGTRRLTLSTCNSFGDESERYVVDADFVRTESL